MKSTISFQGVISVKKQHKAGKGEEEDNERAAVGVSLQIEYQGGPLRGGDIHQIWKEEKELDTEWFHTQREQHGQRSRGGKKLRNSKEATVAGREQEGGCR